MKLSEAVDEEKQMNNREKKEKNDRKEDEDVDLYGDDDDFLLYGESTIVESKYEKNDKNDKSGSGEKSRKRKRLGHDAIQSSRGGEQSDALDPTKSFANVTFWLILAHENGRLVIHSLPDLKVVYQIGKFPVVPELLNDISAEEEEKEKKAKAHLAVTAQEQTTAELLKPEEKVLEAQIIGMGINQSHPILMAIVDEQVVMYEMFRNENNIPEHLCVSFRKLPQLICLRKSSFLTSEGKRAKLEIGGQEGEKKISLIHSFERISSVTNGVIIIGPVPTLVIYGSWGGIQTHQMTIDGGIKALTPFNNENVLYGFVYLTEKSSELRIARLLHDFDYEMPYPVKKIEVDKNVHFIRYLMNSDVYAVVSSIPIRINKIWVVMNDDKQEEVHEKDENFVLPVMPKYTLNLFSSQDWAAVPNTDLVFDDMEAVTACEDVALKSESTMSGMETYLAMATINNYGEEVLVRGRIILCEVIEVVPEPGQPTSNRKIKVLYDKEQKGPVTGLCAMNGLLLTGMGQKVFIWQYKDGDLMGLSFLDMHYYINTIVSMRSIALACDIEDSVSLIRFQEQYKAMSVASRDDRKCRQPPMVSQFVVDGNRVGFVLSDEAGNITLFNYSPEVAESNGGERLIVKAAMNIGTNINAFLRMKGHTSLLPPSTSVEEKEAAEQRQTTVFASLDGSFGFIRPLSEKSYRRLHFLQSFIGSVTPQVGGLHTKGARQAKPSQPIVNGRNTRNLVDGDVVEQFLHLSTTDKQDLARRLGASRYHIIDDLIQLQRMSFYF